MCWNVLITVFRPLPISCFLSLLYFFSIFCNKHQLLLHQKCWKIFKIHLREGFLPAGCLRTTLLSVNGHLGEPQGWPHHREFTLSCLTVERDEAKKSESRWGLEVKPNPTPNPIHPNEGELQQRQGWVPRSAPPGIACLSTLTLCSRRWACHTASPLPQSPWQGKPMKPSHWSVPCPLPPSTCKDSPRLQPLISLRLARPPLRVGALRPTWHVGFASWAAAEARLADGTTYRCFRNRRITSFIDE